MCRSFEIISGKENRGDKGLLNSTKLVMIKKRKNIA